MSDIKAINVFAGILENIASGVWLSDKSDVIYYANKAVEAIAGVPVAQLVGAHVLTGFGETTLQYFKPLYIQAKETLRPVKYDAISVVTPGRRQSYQSGWIMPEVIDGTFNGMICTVEDITAKKAAEKGEEKFKVIFEQAPVGVEQFDQNGRLIEANAATLDMFGINSIESIKGFDLFEDPNISPDIRTDIKKGKSVKFESIFDFDVVKEKRLYDTTKSGKMYISVYVSPIIGDMETPRGYLAHVEDISERKQNELEYRTILGTTMDGFWLADRHGKMLDINDAYCHLIGYTREELLNMNISDIEAMENPEETALHIKRVIEAGHGRFETRHRRKDGSIVDVEISTNYTNIEGGRLFVFARDISERKRAEEKIRYVSFHDTITGLYNRAYGEEEIRRLDTGRELPISIIMGDVNYLKLTNDAFGHEEGDKLLKHVGLLMQSCCRNEDIIVRWGGDEFVMILPKTDCPAAEAVARRIKETKRGAIVDTVLHPSIALGIATKVNNKDDVYQILRAAENRMYTAKALESSYNQELIIDSLTQKLKNKTKVVGGLLQRAKSIFSQLGSRMELTDKEISDLNTSLLLHEFGKIAIPDAIFMKRGPLSPEEFEIVKQHSETGYRIARGLNDYAPVADTVLSVHEYWNGEGYPRNLIGDAIPYLSRILLVVIAYDAMTHERPYKFTFSHAEAIEELRRNAGKQFDPVMVELYIESATAVLR